MSGPKAVRVVSREERIARCERVLAQLDAEAKEWFAVGERLELLSDSDRSATSEKLASLRTLLDADNFDRVERQAPVVIGFLRQDLEQRVSSFTERKRREKTEQRRLGAAAQQTLCMAKSARKVLSIEVASLLEDAAAGVTQKSSDIQTSINSAIAEIASTGDPKHLSEEQRALAAGLQSSKKVENIINWVVENPQFDDDLATKVDRYIVDLEASYGSSVSEPFAERAVAAREITNRVRRRMTLDTLIIDLASDVKSRKKKNELRKRAVSLRAFFDQDQGLEDQEVRRRLERLIQKWESLSVVEVEQTLDDIADLAEKVESKIAAKHRRSALLEAFSELGYEIREGLETAWVQDRRIVVRKPDQSDHGVEISGNTEGLLLQARPVRFGAPGAPSDKRKDIDIETAWCSEFGELQKILDEAGGELVIERAKAIGETPVKVVESSKRDSRRRDVARPEKKKRRF